jgi:hypothetical protein
MRKKAEAWEAAKPRRKVREDMTEVAGVSMVKKVVDVSVACTAYCKCSL